jgi:hypothetical protein
MLKRPHVPGLSVYMTESSFVTPNSEVQYIERAIPLIAKIVDL